MPPFVLLRFHAPEYAMDDERGVVKLADPGRILVASEGREGDGFLEIQSGVPEPAPGRAKIHVEVEIASFYPAIALRLARWVYAKTQSRIHVLVTHGFLARWPSWSSRSRRSAGSRPSRSRGDGRGGRPSRGRHTEITVGHARAPSASRS